LVQEAVVQLNGDFDKFGHVGFVAPLFFSDAVVASIQNITGQVGRW